MQGTSQRIGMVERYRRQYPCLRRHVEVGIHPAEPWLVRCTSSVELPWCSVQRPGEGRVSLGLLPGKEVISRVQGFPPRVSRLSLRQSGRRMVGLSRLPSCILRR